MRRSGGATTIQDVLSLAKNKYVNANLTVGNDSLNLKVIASSDQDFFQFMILPNQDSFQFIILKNYKNNAAFILAKKFLYDKLAGMVKHPNKYPGTSNYFGLTTKADAEKFLKSLTFTTSEDSGEQQQDAQTFLDGISFKANSVPPVGTEKSLRQVRENSNLKPFHPEAGVHNFAPYGSPSTVNNSGMEEQEFDKQLAQLGVLRVPEGGFKIIDSPR
jgi:hypothetical protein